DAPAHQRGAAWTGDLATDMTIPAPHRAEPAPPAPALPVPQGLIESVPGVAAPASVPQPPAPASAPQPPAPASAPQPPAPAAPQPPAASPTAAYPPAPVAPQPPAYHSRLVEPQP